MLYLIVLEKSICYNIKKKRNGFLIKFTTNITIYPYD